MFVKNIVNSLCFMFGDCNDIVLLVKSFFMVAEFDKNTQDYNSPLVKTSHGIFGLGQTTYRIQNPLERALYNVFDQFNKLDFYEMAVNKIRTNREPIRRFIALLQAADDLHDNNRTNEFIANIAKETRIFSRNFCYVVLKNLNEDVMKLAFKCVKENVARFESAAIDFCRHIQETTHYDIDEQQSRKSFKRKRSNDDE